jgi:hypothetical protein
MTGRLLQRVEQLVEADRTPHADLEDAAPGAILPAPVAGERSNVGRSHIVHGDEVARLLAVAEDGAGCAALRRRAPFGDHAAVGRVGALARAVDIEIAEDHGLHAVGARVKLEPLFGQQFAGCIGRQRLDGRSLIFAARQVAVDGAGGGQHKATNAGLARRLEQHCRAFGVDPQRGHRFGHRLGHAHQRGEMEHAVAAGHGLRDGVRVGDVTRDQLCVIGQVAPVARAQVIQHAHPVAGPLGSLHTV